MATLTTASAIESDASASKTGESAPSLVRGSTTAIAGGLISQAFKAAVMICVARGFGLGDFGSFSFANSINAFLSIIAQFGLPVYGAREVAQSGQLEKGLLMAITEARLLLSISGTAIALVVLHFALGVTRLEFWLVAGFGLSNVALCGFGDWAFQGLGRLNLWAVLNITWQGLWLIITVAAARAHASVLVVSFGYAGAAFAAGSFGWLWLGRLRGRPDKCARVPLYSVRSVIGSGASLGAATFLMTALGWADTIIVRLVKGQEAAGVYAAGNRVALALCMLAGFYVLGAFPKLSHSALRSPQNYSNEFQRALGDLAVLFIPGVLWALFYTPRIILVLFNKPEYLAAAAVFRIFLVFLLLNVLTNLFGMGTLVAHHRDHAYRRCMAISAGTLVVLCPILTLRWGILGAAVAALLGQSLNLVLFMVEARDVVRPDCLKTMGVPVLMAVIPVLSGTVFHVGFWGSAVVLVLAYLAIAVWRWPVLATSTA